jgi:hypothetical protein
MADEQEQAAPAAPTEADGLNTLSPDSLSYWRTEVRRSRDDRTEAAERFDWQGNLDRYAPPNVKKTAGEVNVGADFSDVERKKAALLFARPDVGLTCDEPQQPLGPPQVNPQTGQPAGPPPLLGSLVSMHQELLNEMLGPCHVDVQPTALKVVFDVLCPAGIGAVKIGYQVTTTQIQPPVLDPVTQQPAVDPLTGEPILGDPVDVPIHEEFYVSRLSPKALLLPSDWKDTDTRKAPWIGYEWQKPISQVRREYKLKEDWEGPRKSGSDKPEFHPNVEGSKSSGHDGDPPISGWTIEYRAQLRGLSEHPDAVWTLTMVDGYDEPLEHKPSPYQTISEQDARLTYDSLKGFSIRTLTLRDLSDSKWVPSDCAVTGPLTRELNKYRTQNIKQRDSARQVILVDTDGMTADDTAKIKAGDINAIIPIEGMAAKGGADAIAKQIATATLGRENYIGQDYMERDRARILGIDANQAGAQSQTKRTATEVQNVQRNSEARFEQERQRVQAWYLDVVRCVDALLLKYGDKRLAVSLIGQRKGGFWAKFKPALAGGYRYAMQVDSGKYLDMEGNRRQLVQFYQMTRQDPLINSQPTITKLAEAFGIDPAEFLAQPKPPQPPPPQAAFSLKGEDLSPLSPQFTLAIKMAQQGGWQISPQDVEAAKAHAAAMSQVAALLTALQPQTQPGQPGAQTKHGGPATQQMSLSKRVEDESGGVPNAPGSQGGVQ